MIIIGVTAIILTVSVWWAVREIRYQQAVIDWCDERESYMASLMVANRHAIASRIPSSSNFRAFFVNGMLSKNGVQNAHHLLTQHEALIAVVRDVTEEIKVEYRKLSMWEQTTPVPEKGWFGAKRRPEVDATITEARVMEKSEWANMLEGPVVKL